MNKTAIVVWTAAITLVIGIITAMPAHAASNSGAQAAAMVASLAIIFIIIIFLLIPALVCGSAAKAKGMSAVAFFFLALIFTPIVGFLAVIAFPDKSNPRISVR